LISNVNIVKRTILDQVEGGGGENEANGNPNDNNRGNKGSHSFSRNVTVEDLTIEQFEVMFKGVGFVHGKVTQVEEGRKLVHVEKVRKRERRDDGEERSDEQEGGGEREGMRREGKRSKAQPVYLAHP